MIIKIYNVVEVHLYPNDNEYYACSDSFKDEETARAIMLFAVKERAAGWVDDMKAFSVAYDTEEYDVEVRLAGEFHAWRIDEREVEV